MTRLSSRLSQLGRWFAHSSPVKSLSTSCRLRVPWLYGNCDALSGAALALLISSVSPADHISAFACERNWPRSSNWIRCSPPSASTTWAVLINLMSKGGEWIATIRTLARFSPCFAWMMLSIAALNQLIDWNYTIRLLTYWTVSDDWRLTVRFFKGKENKQFLDSLYKNKNLLPLQCLAWKRCRTRHRSRSSFMEVLHWRNSNQENQTDLSQVQQSDSKNQSAGPAWNQFADLSEQRNKSIFKSKLANYQTNI